MPAEVDPDVALVAGVDVVVEVVVEVAPLVVVVELEAVLEVPAGEPPPETVPVVVAPLTVAGVVEIVLASDDVAADELVTDMVTDLLVVPEFPLQVILIVVFPYNGGVERLPDIATKLDKLPLVAKHDVAEVADQVISEVAPLLTDSGLAVSWMSGAASARGRKARSAIAWRTIKCCRIGKLRTSARRLRVDARSPMSRPAGSPGRVSIPRQLAFFYRPVTRAHCLVADRRQRPRCMLNGRSVKAHIHRMP